MTYKTVKRVILRDFTMPSCCRECDYEGMGPYDDDSDIPVDIVSLPLDNSLPFCIINAENISDDTVRAAHCPLKEVDVLEEAERIDSEEGGSTPMINVEFNINLPEQLCDSIEDYLMDKAFKKAVEKEIAEHKAAGRPIYRVDPKTGKCYEELPNGERKYKE